VSAKPRRKLKIGVVYDLDRPVARWRLELQYIVPRSCIDQFVKTGSRVQYRWCIYADAQSKPDVAHQRGVRLIEQEKVDMVLGFYSSRQCVPVARRVEQLKKFIVDHDLHLFGVLETATVKYVSAPSPAGQPVRADDHGFHQQNAKGQARQGPQGAARRHCSRGGA